MLRFMKQITESFWCWKVLIQSQWSEYQGSYQIFIHKGDQEEGTQQETIELNLDKSAIEQLKLHVDSLVKSEAFKQGRGE